MVSGSHYFIVTLVFVKPMNDPSFVLLSKYLGDDVMGYISHPKVLSSLMLGF